MIYSLLTEQKCKTTIAEMEFIIDSFQISAENKFKFQPMALSGIKFGKLGRHPAILKIRGRVRKGKSSNPAVRFNSDMDNGIKYFITIEDLYFNAVSMKKFNVENETDSDFYVCNMEFYCDSYISGGE